MTTLELWLLRVVIVLTLAAGEAAAVWFAADAHYSRAYVALQADYQQATKDQAAEAAATLSRYAAASQEVNDEAQKQLAGMAATLADLRLRAPAAGQPTVSLCTAQGPGRPPDAAVGPAAAGSPGGAPSAAGSGIELAIDAGALGDTLDVAIDALSAELLWRQYARQTGQVSAAQP